MTKEMWVRTFVLAAVMAASAAIPMQELGKNSHNAIRRIPLKKLSQTPRQVLSALLLSQHPVNPRSERGRVS